MLLPVWRVFKLDLPIYSCILSTNIHSLKFWKGSMEDNGVSMLYDNTIAVCLLPFHVRKVLSVIAYSTKLCSLYREITIHLIGKSIPEYSILPQIWMFHVCQVYGSCRKKRRVYWSDKLRSDVSRPGVWIVGFS